MKTALVVASVLFLTGCETLPRHITITERNIEAAGFHIGNIGAASTQIEISEGDDPMRSCVVIAIAQKGKVLRVQSPACQKD